MENTNPMLNPETGKTASCCRKRFWPCFIFLLVIIIVILIGISIYLTSQASSLVGNTRSYKAVFLTSGQAYFGKVVSETKKTIVLREAHYLQAANENEGYNLMAVGSEIYGPTNEVRINKDQVAFIETLSSTSEVAKKIQGGK
ncbi:MAG: hypothetical protein PHV78_02725 [Patescibacteria group bacterium]|nr:hypothetical protein [Patescibacteria group bacterium]MDD5121699.1 hypothetical protein [Patescibacteria group bacterium]MDD5221694.1 hypothetical protein [Patescibacteria group bacterium]MDD5396137.1 hypothetical protein [Patescibacteria group bacterium]